MRLCYVLLSPTFGMHQYAADLANRMVQLGHDVHLVTTTKFPSDRYGPGVVIHTPVCSRDRGLSLGSLQPRAFVRTCRLVHGLKPDVVHFAGPHLWNTILLPLLTSQGIPTVHTLHDLHPHVGAAYGSLLLFWNKWVCLSAKHLLVHAHCYRRELQAQGIPPARVRYTPLTHLFVDWTRQPALDWSRPPVRYEPWALFFGRLTPYKGLKVLIEACRRMCCSNEEPARLVIAGGGQPEELARGTMPANVDVYNRFIDDEEAVDLFSRCSLVVLPYIEASQSALVAAAYSYSKPVIVTRAGALPEYVAEGETGWVVDANDPQVLADTIQAALDDPLRLKRMGEAGRIWYEHQRRAELAELQAMYAKVMGDQRYAPEAAVGFAGLRPLGVVPLSGSAHV